MNYWATMLLGLPTLAQRAIARSQRISLPRNADLHTRATRLRQALCRAVTVRVTYAALDPQTQSAIQELRRLRGGIDPETFAARYGLFRPWHLLARDPQPQSVAERLLLLGWVLPRPAAPHHPARLLVPPELRQRLPVPAAFPTYGPAPEDTIAPALLGAHALLAISAQQPLAVRQNGQLTSQSLRTIKDAIGDPPLADLQPLANLLLPVLCQIGLVACAAGTCQIAPAASTFLRLPAHVQLDRLRAAWVASPEPDRWLVAQRVNPLGIDWLVLRHRLCQWVAQLPCGQLVDPAESFPQLVNTLGPLADAHTHGFRRIRRTPWNTKRAAAIWQTALRGPLAWFGYVVWQRDLIAAIEPAPVEASTLDHLIPARLINNGMAAGPVRIEQGTIISAPPALLRQLRRQRTMRRVLKRTLAPGVSMVAPDQTATLINALNRAALPLAIEPPSIPLAPPSLPTRPSRRNDPILHPGECAAILVACAYYQQYGPTNLPLHVPDTLLDRLRASLPRRLREATEATINACAAPHTLPRTQHGAVPCTDAPLTLLQRAITTQSAVEIDYRAGRDGVPSTRTIRPLELEQVDDTWYVRAFCTLRDDERVFRVDRIVAVRKIP